MTNTVTYDWTAEEQQAIFEGDPAAFVNPTTDPVILSIFGKWATAAGHQDVYDMVQFMPYFEQAFYYGNGWDQLDELLAVTQQWFSGEEFETFKAIVTEHDDSRRDDAMQYVSDQLAAMQGAIDGVRDEFLAAMETYRTPRGPFQMVEVVDQVEEAPQLVQYVDVAGAEPTSFPEPPGAAGGSAGAAGGEAAGGAVPDGAGAPAGGGAAPDGAQGGGEGRWQVPAVLEQPEVVPENVPGWQVPVVVDQPEVAPETVQVTNVVAPLDQVVDWDTLMTEDQRALKEARQPGTRLPFWQLGEWVLLGPGHPAEYYEAFTTRDAVHGEVTIVSRAARLGSDPGLIRVSGCGDEAAFEAAIRRFSRKRIEFVGGTVGAAPSLT